MKNSKRNCVVIVILYFCSSLAYGSERSEYEKCVLQKIDQPDNDITLSQLKESCLALNPELNTHRDTKITVPVSLQNNNPNKYIMAFKPNYILPYVYNSLGYNAELLQTQLNSTEDLIDDTEVQFQISVKILLTSTLFNSDDNAVYMAFTNRSFWQLYNNKISAPFRETNYEPELWFQQRANIDFLGFKESTSTVGIAHQSNGRTQILSRSWNRIYLQYKMEKESLLVSIKLWKRIQESFEKDDNPDLTDFLGHGEIQLKYIKNTHIISLLSRNNLESNFTKGALELGWSFPLMMKSDLKGYIQAFSGYGESLIDYNKRVARIGIGILISDWI